MVTRGLLSTLRCLMHYHMALPKQLHIWLVLCPVHMQPYTGFFPKSKLEIHVLNRQEFWILALGPVLAYGIRLTVLQYVLTKIARALGEVWQPEHLKYFRGVDLSEAMLDVANEFAKCRILICLNTESLFSFRSGKRFE